MRALALLLLAAAPTARAYAAAKLNGSSFDNFISGHDAAVIFVYVPWCGHSRAMQPQFERAAHDVRAALEASGGGKSCGFGKLDASTNDELASRYGVEGYPTLLLIHNALGGHGDVSDGSHDGVAKPPAVLPREFRGERTAAAITAWVLNQLEPRLPVIRSVAEARALLSPLVKGSGASAASYSSASFDAAGGGPVAAVIALIPPGHAPALLSAVRLAAAELDSVPWVLCPSPDASQIGAALASRAAAPADSGDAGGGDGGGEGLALPALLVLSALGDEASVLSLAPWDGPESGWEVPRSGGFAALLYAQGGGENGGGHGGAVGSSGVGVGGTPSAAVHRLGAYLAEWADAHSLPLLVPYTEHSAEKVFATRADFYAMLLHSGPSASDGGGGHGSAGGWTHGRGAKAQHAARPAAGAREADEPLPQPIVAAVRAAASAGLRGPFLFATVSAAEHPELAEYAGLAAPPRAAPPSAAGDGTAAADGEGGAGSGGEAGVLPALVVLQPTTGRKYVFTLTGTAAAERVQPATAMAAAAVQAASPEQLVDLLHQIRFGALQPTLRSAPPLSPAPQPVAGRVTEIVGSDYASVILNPAWHVLVYVYAPWCGHCLRFNRTYAEIAEELAPVPTVVLVQLDGTANELPNLPVGAYPSLFLYTRGHKDEPIEFTGVRSRVAVTHFVLAELGDDDREHLARTMLNARSDPHEHRTAQQQQQAAGLSGAKMEL